MTDTDTLVGSNKRPRLDEAKETDDLQVLSSNTTNPLSSFPHSRHQCAKYPFFKHPSPKNSNMKEPKNTSCLEGKTFVFSGELQTISRADTQDFVRKFGGRVTTAVSGRTHYLVCGANMDCGRLVTSGNKYKKAHELNEKKPGTIQIIHGNQEFDNLIRRLDQENGGGEEVGPNASFCDKCFCYVCDLPAKDCPDWADHCNAHDGEDIWKAKRQSVRGVPEQELCKAANDDGDDVIEIIDSPRATPLPLREIPQQRHEISRLLAGGLGSVDDDMMDDFDMGGLYGEKMRNRRQQSSRNSGPGGDRENRIVDVLAANLKKLAQINDDEKGPTQFNPVTFEPVVIEPPKHAIRKMEGDIPQLNLSTSFIVEGVKIGWPFPMIMPPQRQMAVHLVKALKNRRHVVLESPTGTGKSVAILTAVLAWKRYNAKVSGGNENVKIIYCSRTHSQVQQMVASLRKTSYRPKMAILGSRDRLCIHSSVVPRHGQGKKAINVNNACQIRVSNTEKFRKQMKKSPNAEVVYDDEDPPVQDGDDDEIMNDVEGEEATQDQGFVQKKYNSCPHYRQLSTTRTAQMVHDYLFPGMQVNKITRGGEASKVGAHDIEDLATFGMNTDVRRGVALYRDPSAGPSFGLTLGQKSNGQGSVTVDRIKEGGAAALEGSISPGDVIIGINGANIDNWDLNRVTRAVKASNDPLILDIMKTSDGKLQAHSACPYYLSRAIAVNAELIFAPYNYVLDPRIRDAMNIDITDAVVVLDEAHNVEDTLRESGSGKFSEFDLCELLVFLYQYTVMGGENKATVPVSMDDPERTTTEEPLCDVAHVLLLFIERIILFLRECKTDFEEKTDRYTGKTKAETALDDWQKYKTPDDRDFEAKYIGPVEKSTNKIPLGCKPLFDDDLNISAEEIEKVACAAEGFEQKVGGRIRGERNSKEGERKTAVLDKLSEVVTVVAYAMKSPEHYYAAATVNANGSFDHAAGDKPGRRARKPKALPFMPPKTKDHPARTVNTCTIQGCVDLHRGESWGSLVSDNGQVRHGSYCDGSTPKWEAHLVIHLLTPGALMQQIADRCRSVVLASGTLAPISSLVGELNLFPPKIQPDGKVVCASPAIKSDSDNFKCSQESRSMNSDEENGKRYGRLQVTPRPLEANHVINLPKQLLALSIGHFRDGSPLTVAYKYYSKKGFMYKLGDAIATVVESIPKGGILIFVPSYSFLKKCTDAWNPTNRSRNWSDEILEDDSGRTIWDRLSESKTRVILEPSSGGQEMFEEKKNEYVQRIKERGSCVLLAVFRGKMSEGVSFNDDNARGVICVGLPYPNARVRSVEAKRAYNDEQRRLRGRTNLLPGMEWYSQQAYRALAQALGRCIRHAADYGTVILMDSRHCDTGGAKVNGVSPAHRNLPKWMRHHMRNLVSGNGFANYQGTNAVCGGFPGLSVEMKRFFAEAPIHAASVLAKQQDSLKAARERTEKQGAPNHYFDGKSGKWCPRLITPQAADPCTPNIKSEDLKSADNGSVGSAADPVVISVSPVMKTPETNRENGER